MPDFYSKAMTGIRIEQHLFGELVQACEQKVDRRCGRKVCTERCERKVLTPVLSASWEQTLVCWDTRARTKAGTT